MWSAKGKFKMWHFAASWKKNFQALPLSWVPRVWGLWPAWAKTLSVPSRLKYVAGATVICQTIFFPRFLFLNLPRRSLTMPRRSISHWTATGKGSFSSGWRHIANCRQRILVVELHRNHQPMSHFLVFFPCSSHRNWEPKAQIKAGSTLFDYVLWACTAIIWQSLPSSLLTWFTGSLSGSWYFKLAKLWEFFCSSRRTIGSMCLTLSNCETFPGIHSSFSLNQKDLSFQDVRMNNHSTFLFPFLLLP